MRCPNLAFGDFIAETLRIDDLSVSGNGVTEKVLATVVNAVYTFFNYYPTLFVYATGSTKSRTRLYRMSISRFFEEMKNDFCLYGQKVDDFMPFEIGVNYEGFLAQRKF